MKNREKTVEETGCQRCARHLQFGKQAFGPYNRQVNASARCAHSIGIGSEFNMNVNCGHRGNAVDVVVVVAERVKRK